MTRPISLRRAAGMYGASFALMMLLSMAFYFLKAPNAGINIPWLSVAISILAVALPTVVASYWPKPGAPEMLPPFKRVSTWLLAGAALLSLPLYIVFAALQIAITKLLALQMETGMVEPLTAGSVGAFLWIWFAVALLPALTEEAMYRGFIQTATVQRWGLVVGLVVASFIFSFAHLEPAGFLSRILMGLWFGYLFWRTGSLWPGALAHTLNNTWGVVLANWGAALEANLPWIYGAGGLALALGLVCLHRAGVFTAPTSPSALAPAGTVGPELPRFITMSRPKPPEAD